MNNKSFLVIMLLTCLHTNTSAQLFQRKKARKTDVLPKAILVEIFTHKRLVNYYTAKNNTKALTQLLIDRDSVKDRLVMDFTDNFSFCPVYFFADTNMQKIKDGNFEGTLLNGQLQPAQNIVLAPGDKNYQVVFFGTYIPDATVSENPYGKSDLFDYDSGIITTRSRKRIIVQGSDGKNIKSPLPNGSNSIYGGPFAQSPAAYRYRSPLLDIYYRPSAKRLSAKMLEYYTPKPSKK